MQLDHLADLVPTEKTRFSDVISSWKIIAMSGTQLAHRGRRRPREIEETRRCGAGPPGTANE